MEEKKFVIYLRVSTRAQDSFETQERIIRQYLDTIPGAKVVGTYREVHSGIDKDRPILRRALQDCSLFKASLIVSALDRLSRKASYVLELLDGETPIVMCDYVGANWLAIANAAVSAQWQLMQTRQRTKEGLARVKATYERRNVEKRKKDYAECVKELFLYLYSAYDYPEDMAEHCNTDKIPTINEWANEKKARGTWTAAEIQQWLEFFGLKDASDEPAGVGSFLTEQELEDFARENFSSDKDRTLFRVMTASVLHTCPGE